MCGKAKVQIQETEKTLKTLPKETPAKIHYN